MADGERLFEVGDEVAIIDRWGQFVGINHVTRVTKTLALVGSYEGRYNRQTGRCVGDRGYIELATDKLRQKARVAKLAYRLKYHEWPNTPLETMEAVVALLDKARPASGGEAAERSEAMSEQFKAGQVWVGPGNRIRRITTIEEARVEYTIDGIKNTAYQTRDTPEVWRNVGYVLLSPDTPDVRLDVLEGRVDALSAKVEALTAKMDVLERPGETEPAPEPDVPRDCTGREVSCGQVVACGEALFEVTGDSLIPVCILPNDGWNYGQEASFIAADWAECRILWPLAERSEE